MGKTMFGIPGVKEKSQSGGAIAPKGTPGGGTEAGGSGFGSLRQSGQQRQNRQPEKAPIAKPAMAQPKPGAHSMTQAQAVRRNKSEASRTMCGMPALNLPTNEIDNSVDAAPDENIATEPSAISQQDASSPGTGRAEASSKTGEKGDMYGATVLGVPAVSDEEARAAVEGDVNGAGSMQSTAKTMIQQAVTVPAPPVASSVAEDITSEELDIESDDSVEEVVSDKPISSLQSPEPLSDLSINEALAPQEQNTVAPQSPVQRSAGPSKGLMAGLIIGFVIVIGAIIFMASQFLFN